MRKLSMDRMPSSQGVGARFTQFLLSKNQIYRYCFTGGPCAGKTTGTGYVTSAMTRIQQSLEEKGFKVFIVPEAATLLQKGGAFISTPQMGMVEAVKF